MSIIIGSLLLRCARISVLCALWCGLLAPVAFTQDGSGGEAAGSESPFDLEDLQVLRASAKKVFAHYFSPYPVSLDNAPPANDYYARGLMSPDGEGKKHIGYGGYFRQRPTPREPLVAQDWRALDMQGEVRLAREIGLDGFCFDILGLKGKSWEALLLLLDSAQKVDPGFKVMLMPDMNGGYKKQPEQMVPSLLQVARHLAIFRDEKGRVVVAPFNGHNQPPAYWQEVKDRMKQEGVEIFFMPLFQGWWKYVDAYAPVCEGFSDWGCATVAEAQIPPRSVAPQTIRKMGKLWMETVRPQDFRPRSYTTFEASNSDLFRVMWQVAIGGDADWVQLVTWNDYSEASEIRPSTKTRYAFYHLSAFYTQWFKTGKMPEIKRDAIFCFYRVQSTEYVPDSAKQKQPFKMVGTPSNQIELLAFLKQPGTLEIEVAGVSKSMDAPAGITSFKIPLVPGKPVFRLKHGASTALELIGREEIVSGGIGYQDLLYRGDCVAEPKSAQGK